MGNYHVTAPKKMKRFTSLDMPDWLIRAESLANRLIVADSEKEIIDLIRKYGGLSKADLAMYTMFSRSKINNCVDSLLKKGILIPSPKTEFTGGRRSRLYGLNGKLGLLAGVDIGATSIDLCITDYTEKILHRYSEPASVKDGPIKILGRVCTLIEIMLKEKGFDVEKLNGIGIGVPGPVDFSSGTLISPPIMPGWDRYPIIDTVQQWFPMANVVVDNDVNVMALGESYKGAGKGIDNLIFIKIGTGIGAGILSEGTIYRGSNGCAGDIGHIGVNKTGPLCHCGNKGCLEAVAAGPAIAEHALQAALSGKSPILLKIYEKKGNKLTAEDVGEAAREGDPYAIEVIRESGTNIGDVLAGLVNFYNPSMIVIGGGVANLGNLLLSTIRQTVLNRSLPLATKDLAIVFSSIGPDAGVTGAVNLAMNYIFTEVSGRGD